MANRRTNPLKLALFLAPLALFTACGSSEGDSGLSGTDYAYQDHIQWSTVREAPWNGNHQGSAHYRDVMNHTTDRYLSSEPTTNAHETMHGLLNQMNNATPAKDQFVYLANGQGAYVTEPAMHASLIKNYVPAGARQLASGRYRLYLVDQVAAYFPNVLYQFDEWNSYVTGARVGVEMFRAGTWNDGGQDVVDGAMDFLYFAAAAAYALQVNEPQYLTATPQFKAAFAMLAEESVRYVDAGLTMAPFSGFHARQLRDHFVTSPENAAIRGFLKQWLGEGWTARVMGF